MVRQQLQDEKLNLAFSGKGVIRVSNPLVRIVSAGYGEEPTAVSERWEKAEREKWLAGSASVLMIVAVLWPVAQNWREKRRDGFPLSYYPMFTAKRSASVKVTHLVGLDRAGDRHQIPYGCAGSGGLNQVRRQINRAVREGRAGALCDSVAARVAPGKDNALSTVTRVQLITGTYRLKDYFSGETRPVSERILASSEVERSPA